MYKTLILALALAAPAMATLPLILTTTSALGVTTATTTLLAAPAVTGLLGAAVIIKGKKVYNISCPPDPSTNLEITKPDFSRIFQPIRF